jgi:hypothetical protein
MVKSLKQIIQYLKLRETVAVTDLSLIGLLAVQLSHAQGCRVLDISFDLAIQP